MYAYKLFYVLNLFCGISSCNINICLAWSVNEKILTLICKVDKLHHKVRFFNQYHKTQGYCLQPFPAPHCFAFYRNSSISQNVSTNETYLTVKGVINNNINGQWSCLHGTNLDAAIVNVTVLRHKETGYSTAPYSCLLWTIIAFFSTIFVSRTILWFFEYKQERPVVEQWFAVFCSFPLITQLCNEKNSPLLLLVVKVFLLLACSTFFIVVPLFGSVDEQGRCTKVSTVFMLVISVVTGVLIILLLLSKGKYSTKRITLTQRQQEEIELQSHV